jgi:hypothetical protein
VHIFGNLPKLRMPLPVLPVVLPERTFALPE